MAAPFTIMVTGPLQSWTPAHSLSVPDQHIIYIPLEVTAHALRKTSQTSPQPKQVTGEVLTLREKLSGITERWDVMASYRNNRWKNVRRYNHQVIQLRLYIITGASYGTSISKPLA